MWDGSSCLGGGRRVRLPWWNDVWGSFLRLWIRSCCVDIVGNVRCFGVQLLGYRMSNVAWCRWCKVVRSRDERRFDITLEIHGRLRPPSAALLLMSIRK